MADAPELQALAPDLWHAEHHVWSGLHLRMRMTVVRRAGGALWLHSPVPIDEALADRLAALGRVSDIVAPNRFHHRFAAAAKRRYPAATLWGAPGLDRKRKDIPFDVLLSEPSPWRELEAVFLSGAPLWNEHVFFHAASRTLICTDLLFNIRDEPSAVTRLLVYRAFGMYRRFGTNRLWRWKTRDRAALAASLDRVVAWDVRRVVMAHGDPVDVAGSAALGEALLDLRR
jgi:hypothetical protein